MRIFRFLLAGIVVLFASGASAAHVSDKDALGGYFIQKSLTSKVIQPILKESGLVDGIPVLVYKNGEKVIDDSNDYLKIGVNQVSLSSDDDQMFVLISYTINSKYDVVHKFVSNDGKIWKADKIEISVTPNRYS